MLLFFTYYSLIIIRTISSAPVSWPNYRTVLGHQGILELYHKSLGRDVSVKRSISSPGWPSYSTLFAFICWMIILTLFLFIHCSGLYSKLLWMMWLQYKPLHFVWIPHHPLLIHCLSIAYSLLIPSHFCFCSYPASPYIGWRRRVQCWKKSCLRIKWCTASTLDSASLLESVYRRMNSSKSQFKRRLMQQKTQIGATENAD